MHQNDPNFNTEEHRAFLLGFLDNLENHKLPELKKYGVQFQGLGKTLESDVKDLRKQVACASLHTLPIKGVQILHLLRKVMLSISSAPVSTAMKEFVIQALTEMGPANQSQHSSAQFIH